MSIPPQLAQDTQRERQSMLAGGMQEITPRQLISDLAHIGYRLGRDGAFSYNNYSNAIPYAARHIPITDTRTGHGFANIHANHEKLPELQAIRRKTSCFVRGRIWEY